MAQHLIDRNVVLLEGVAAACQIDTPDAELLFCDFATDPLGMLFVVFAPELQGAGLVAPQVFYIQDFQPAILHGRQDLADVWHFAVREYIGVDKAPRAQRRFIPLGVA